MPIYEYQCDECGASFEVMQKMSEDPLTECEKCGGSLRKVMHPVAIHFKGSGFYTTDYGKGSGRRAGGRESGSDGSFFELHRELLGRRRLRQEREEEAGLRRRQGQGDAEGDLTRRGVSRVERPTDEALRKAQTTLRGLVSDGPSRLPSLNLVADSIRLELEKSRPGRPPLRQPGPLRPPRAGVRLAHRRRDPRRGGRQPRGHGGQHPPPPRRGQRLHAHRRRLHRAAVAAAVRGGDRDERPRGGDAARLRASAVAAAQRPGARRVRPRASIGRVGRPRRRRRPHLRAEPAARPRPGDAGGRTSRRRSTTGDWRRRWPTACPARRPRAAVRARRGPRGAGRSSATAAACAGPSTRRCGCRTCCSTSRAARRSSPPTASSRARPR